MGDHRQLFDATLRMRRILPVPPERVFEAWTEPAQLMQWFCPGGYALLAVEVDLRVGGTYRFDMRTPEGHVGHIHGRYIEVRPVQRLVYTWAWEAVTPAGEPVRSEETTVTVEFLDVGGSTEVVLTHERFADLKSKEQHQSGWAGTLDRLDTLVRVG